MVRPRPALDGPTATGAVDLGHGFNLATWTGVERTIEQAIVALGDNVAAIYAWDPINRVFRIHRVAAPSFLNDLEIFQPGQAMWVEMKRAATWQQT